ncbi:MAG: carboxypeptidase regulatory-like domain-containing protein [Flavobacteriales bacterium]|jgi:hypothetical protein|nr:carboxypeptidase regulatory-like domain-containing protein [Flavobacteriales bacterium]
MKLAFILLFILSNVVFPNLCGWLLAQQDNALPPGPGRIFGTVVDGQGQPMAGVEIQVRYPDGKQRKADTFTSTQYGTFTCYVFRYDQPNVQLVFTINGRECLRKSFFGIGEGTNFGRDADVYPCIRRKSLFRRIFK